MSTRVIYLDKPRHVRILHSFLATQTHCKAHCTISTHTKLATKFGVSLATIKRDLAELEKQGYIRKGHIQRNRGGFLCIYWVVAGIIFKVKSFLRKANELVQSYRKDASQANFNHVADNGTKSFINTNKDNTSDTHSSIPDSELEGLMTVADHLPVTLDDTQKSYLELAAKKFGVTRTWIALLRAVQTGKYGANEVVRVVWCILKRQVA